ncbi:MAG: hypothetical protein EZS28_047634 [Streblomastix strix]|uniref:MULE transposase domain-containing protein n=1 Tax=Streblomastix strix TaxID=222440 RepID=A0A5J4TFD5_9EUKA|nr:MAG: hypothetical protein EZS28_047634 [Streblomastix strix]
MDSTYCTNSENLIINQMVGVTSENTSFFRCHAILSNERAETFKWLFDQYINIMGTEYYPSVVVTDKDPAIMSVIGDFNYSFYHLICRWHLITNVKSTAASRLGNMDKAEEAGEQMKLVIFSDLKQQNSVITGQIMYFIQDAHLHKEQKHLILFQKI